jgi:hypothetical protein
MSVTFHVQHEHPDLDGDRYLNLANANARDLLRWLGYAPCDLNGLIPGPELASRCRERLRLIAGNIDPARLPSEWRGANGCRVLYFGRHEGYLHDRCEQLLLLAEAAGERNIVYG